MRRGFRVLPSAEALTFYGGPIYSAVNGAYKFNDDQQAAYLREQRLRFGLVLRL